MKKANAKGLVAAAALVLGSSVTASAASGCEATLELDTDQVRHHLDLLKSVDADELDQLDVLAALMCADRPGVRDLAARTALASPNPSIRSETLLGVMQQKQNMVVEFIEEEGVSNEVRSYIQDNIALEYQLNHVEGDPSCAGLDTNKDCKNYFVDITGNNVEITYGRDLGSFSLDENGELHGFFKPAGLAAKVPAKIKLL